jgi:NTP pyrophosphatase (non-canonical NTP hydrolase)
VNKYQKEIKEFCEERDWEQFFDPKDLMLGIVEEIGELRNIVKWLKTREESAKALVDNKDEVKDAVGDIFWFLSLLANSAGVDIDESAQWVIEDNKKRFPVEKVKGQHTNIKSGGHDGKYIK